MTEQPVTRGWAFLVARGRRKGYRSVLVPDFLAESNEYGVLGETVGGDFPPSGAPRIESVSTPVTGVITLAYQTQRLTYADLDDEQLPVNSTASSHAPDDVVTDEHGRPLDLLYGFVCRAPGIRETDEVDLIAARAEALRAYRRFLADETGFMLESSTSFALRSVTSGPEELGRAIPPPRITTQPPGGSPLAAAAHSLPTRGRSALIPIIVAVLVVIVSVIVWIMILRPERGPVTEVDVAEPDPGTVDCTAPDTVVFRATVSTNDRAVVEYHWEGSVDNTDTVRRRLMFHQAASKPVETKLSARGLPGEEITGDQTLVIDAPNHKEDSVEYRLICKDTDSE